MKLRSLAITLVFSMGANAQIKAPEKGSVWVYDYANVSACGPIKSVYERDTLLAGKNAMIFEETLYNKCTHPQDNKSIDTIGWGANIIAIEDSLVWYWQGVKFDTLINFGAEVGDQWMYSNSADSMLCEVEGVVSDANLGVGVSVTYSWNIDNIPQTSRDTIYETLLGGSGYILPNDIYQSFLDGQEGGPLVCFSNSKGRYSDGVWTEGGIMCTDIIEKLSVSNLAAERSFKIYPNPSLGKIYLESLTNQKSKEVMITDTKGVLIYESNSLETLSSLAPQLYFVKIIRQDGMVEVHRVVVE